jgi:hypothetical protein
MWFAQDQRILGSSPDCMGSLHLHMFISAARLVYQRLSGVWIACDSCTQKTPWEWDHSKRVRESPWLWVPEVGITGLKWCKKRHILPTSCLSISLSLGEVTNIVFCMSPVKHQYASASWRISYNTGARRSDMPCV